MITVLRILVVQKPLKDGRTGVKLERQLLGREWRGREAGSYLTERRRLWLRLGDEGGERSPTFRAGRWPEVRAGCVTGVYLQLEGAQSIGWDCPSLYVEDFQ